MGRPETDEIRQMAMQQLGNGLFSAKHYNVALSVREAELAMLRHVGASEYDMLVVQGNLANSYQRLGRPEEALLMRRDVYCGQLKFDGEESIDTLRAALNYTSTLTAAAAARRRGPPLRRAPRGVPWSRRGLG